jgi:hypothetical protein
MPHNILINCNLIDERSSNEPEIWMHIRLCELHENESDITINSSCESVCVSVFYSIHENKTGYSTRQYNKIYTYIFADLQTSSIYLFLFFFLLGFGYVNHNSCCYFLPLLD